MALAPFLFDDFYQLKGDGTTITMDLIFGDLGQSPDYRVTLAGRVLIPDANHDGTASVKDFPLGKDVDIVDQILVVTGLITDMPGTSDVLRITFRISGGKSLLIKNFSVNATTGDHVDISLTVRFFQ